MDDGAGSPVASDVVDEAAEEVSAVAEVAVLAVRVAMTCLATLAGATAIVERASLGGWTFGIVVAAAAVVLAVWSGWSARSRLGAVVAAVLAVAGVAMAATGADRSEGRMAARVLARDLPPRAVYAVVLAFMLVAVGGIVLAGLWPRATSTSGRALRRGVGAGIVAAVILSATTVAGAGLLRSLDDRRLESTAQTHTVTRPAERRDDEPGPVRLDRQVWDTDLPGARSGRVTSAAVPGWDVILVHQDDGRGEATTTRLAALSASTGSELWSYERHGEIDGVTADPASGRVLLVSRSAAVVLSLRDGDELSATRLPDDLACWRSVDGRFAGPTGPDLEVGATAVMICGDDGDRPPVDQPQLVAVLEAATGTVVATGESPGDQGDCVYAAPAAAARPVLVRWGLAGPDGSTECGPPMLLAADPAGEIRPVAEVAPPAEASGDGCRRPTDTCATSGLVAGGDTIVLTLDWPGGDADDQSDVPPLLDLVALSPNGDLLWRHTGEGAGGSVVAATDRHVAVRDGTGWRLLSLADGRELARSPDRGGDAALDSPAAAPISDGVHIYAFTYDVGLVVPSAEDLAPVATAANIESSIHDPFVAAGLLVVPRQHGDDGYRLVAYGDDPASGP